MQPAALIAALPHAGVRALAEMGHVRTYPKQTVIIQEGDVADTLYVLLAGRLRVYSATADGREVVLDVLGPGELIGEMALDGSPRSASVMTMEPSTVAITSVGVLRERVAADGDLALRLIVELLGRLRRTSRTVKQLALADVYERMALVLAEESARSPTPGTIAGLTQQELADRIGASRDMVNRIFKGLIEGGYVEVARRRITLLKALPARW